MKNDNLKNELLAIGEVAVQASLLGGKLALEDFGNSKILLRKGEFDVQISTDIAAEKAVIGFIKSKFPEHSFYSEETADINYVDAKHLWVIDPLEGSNNHILGFPYFGVAVSYFYEGEIILSSINEPILGHCYYSQRGQGTTLNGNRVEAFNSNKFKFSTISLVNDYSREGREKGLLIYKALGEHCKRVTTMWAPAIDLVRIAGSLLDGMLCWNGMYLDSCSGLLMVSEAGGIITDLEGQDLKLSDLSLKSPVSFIAACNKDIIQGASSCLKTLDKQF